VRDTRSGGKALVLPSMMHQSPRAPALPARCQRGVGPAPAPAHGTVTVGATSDRAAVPILPGVGLGIHVLQGDHTVGIGAVLHLVTVVRHVHM
jgi:hypothetical protein